MFIFIYMYVYKSQAHHTVKEDDRIDNSSATACRVCILKNKAKNALIFVVFGSSSQLEETRGSGNLRRAEEEKDQQGNSISFNNLFFKRRVVDLSYKYFKVLLEA